MVESVGSVEGRIIIHPELSTFASLREHHARRAPAHWFFKPMSVELEMTALCNMRCQGCAIIEDVEEGRDDFATGEILRVLTELEALGAYSFALTGGEPFAKMEALLEIIRSAPLDLLKIQTNGKLFSSFERARHLLERLAEAGFGRRNRYVRPSINLSMGMQTDEGVPIENVVHFTCAFLRTLSASANFAINIVAESASDMLLYLYDLECAYHALTGDEFPAHKALWIHHLNLDYTERLHSLGRTGAETATVQERIEALPDGYTCMNFTFDEELTPAPRILVRADGTMYPCSCFGHVAAKGNVHRDSMRALLELTNEDRWLRIVESGGLRALLEAAARERPEILDVRVPAGVTVCKVCKAIREPEEPLFVRLRGA